MTLLLADPPVYGPVFQGEGTLIGTPTVFVRAAACDYRCSWCDTMHAVDPRLYKHEWKRFTVAEVLARIQALMPPGWVTLSGGNPCLQDFGELVVQLRMRHYLVAVETQGTKAPEWLRYVDHLTVSPKGPSSGHMTESATVRDCLLTQAALGSSDRSACLKVVVFDESDLCYAQEVHGACRDLLQAGSFVLQAGTPRGGTQHDILESLRRLEGMVRIRNINARVLPQLHALVHGARRDG